MPKKQVEDSSNTLIKRTKIVFDGKQYLVRFPTEVSETLELQKGDEIEFKIPLPESREEELKPIITYLKKKK